MEKNKLIDSRLTGTFLAKNRKTYVFLLGLIAIFELIMIVRGFVSFDFSSIRRVLYMISYGILLVASLSAIPVLIKSRSLKVLSLTMHVYATLILIWSLIITYLDMQRGGYPIVYMTIIVTLGGVVVISPILYTVFAVFSTGAIFFMDNLLGNKVIDSKGGYINLLVFLAMCLVISFRQFILLRNELENKDFLEELAVKDTLTGLANENAYISYTMKMKEDKYAVVVLDVNNLKRTNEKLGHKFGTFLITETAKILESIFSTSSIYHTEGDTFVVVVEGKDLENIVSILSSLEAKVSNNQLTLDETPVTLSVAYGVAFHLPGQDYDQVFHLADTSMREKKQEQKRSK